MSPQGVLSVCLALAALAGPALATVVLLPLATTTGTTTLTVGTTAAVATTAAAAAAGAVVVGVTAAALLAAGGSDRRGSHGRHRRAVDDLKVKEALTLVARIDTQGCGMRHVCEVFRKTQDSLTPTENNVRLLIGNKPEPVNPKEAKHPWALYQSAAVLGQRGEDCYTLYRSCPLSHSQLNDYLNTLDLF